MSKNDNRKTEETKFYTVEQSLELIKCKEDPLYFINNYIRLPAAGHPNGVLFKTYKYQEKMVNGIHENKNTMLMASRQTGKCLYFSTIITHNKSNVKIKDIINQSIRHKIISWLEEKLFLLHTE